MPDPARCRVKPPGALLMRCRRSIAGGWVGAVVAQHRFKSDADSFVKREKSDTWLKAHSVLA